MMRRKTNLHSELTTLKRSYDRNANVYQHFRGSESSICEDRCIQ